MRRALLAASSAALLLAAAPPFNLTPLVLVALVPLLLAARHAVRVRTAAALGWMSGAILYAGLLVWLPATIARLQQCRLPAAVALSMLFIAAHALQVACAASAARLGCSPPARVAASVAGWVLLEWRFPKVFPWSLGAVLGPHPLLRQAADLAGAYGLAALVVAVNALTAEAVESWRGDRSAAGGALALAALLTIGAASYGLRQSAAAPASGGGRVRIAVVQAGQSSAAHAEPRAASAAAWAGYARLSETVAGGAEVIVWPEAVLAVYLREAPWWRTRAEALARRLRSTVVVGALDRADDGGERSAAYFFTPTLTAVAGKATLVPFAEYLPGAARLSPLRAWRPPFARRAAPPPPVVDVGIRIAPSICIEAIVPGHFNAAVRDGAEVLVNLSDDSWFASSWAATVDLEMARLRAVEARRWLVRASHSGISAVIDPRGDVVARLAYGARGTLVRAVEPGHRLTPYARCGDAPLLSGALAALLLAAIGRVRNVAQARSNSSSSASVSARTCTARSPLNAAPSPARSA